MDDDMGFSGNWKEPFSQESFYDGIDMQNLISVDGSDAFERSKRGFVL